MPKKKKNVIGVTGYHDAYGYSSDTCATCDRGKKRGHHPKCIWFGNDPEEIKKKV